MGYTLNRKSGKHQALEHGGTQRKRDIREYVALHDAQNGTGPTAGTLMPDAGGKPVTGGGVAEAVRVPFVTADLQVGSDPVAILEREGDLTSSLELEVPGGLREFATLEFYVKSRRFVLK